MKPMINAKRAKTQIIKLALGRKENTDKIQDEFEKYYQQTVDIGYVKGISDAVKVLEAMQQERTTRG